MYHYIENKNCICRTSLKGKISLLYKYIFVSKKEDRGRENITS